MVRTHVVLHTLEHICGDKKQTKRDFMEIEKYQLWSLDSQNFAWSKMIRIQLQHS